MLTLTASAVRVIRALTEQQGMTSEAGVRLSNDNAGTYTVSFAPWPRETDRVVEVSGARLFVAADVATAVDNKSLDATMSHDGEVLFSLRDRPHPIARRPTTGPRRGRRRPPRRAT